MIFVSACTEDAEGCDSEAIEIEDVMEEFRLNGRDFEYCPDLDPDVAKQITPRRKKNKKPLPTVCVFCRNNGEEESYYRKHLLKDDDGRVRCPVLRAYTCPICGACGDEAHTVKYCPKGPYNPNSISTANAFKLLRNSMGKRRGKKEENKKLFDHSELYQPTGKDNIRMHE
ncbi:nanos homolog 3 isoform X2 [Odontomachus brunneus]|uniref:nanos homolog 3 isoform X2 n=1 Tax=Odontomachus brunneus TaxID=486640 RepID=UPI0013F28D1B|nr:nanos homolog 3 isoform X2 [Odontomachus brunneus]